MVNVGSLLVRGLLEATPIALAALGEALVERTGRINLGVEGLMSVGAAFSVLVGLHVDSSLIALLLGGLSGLLLSLVYVLFVVILGADQIVTGLTIVFMGLGLAELLGLYTGGAPGTPLGGLGPIDYVVIASIVTSVISWYILYRTWLGVELRAIGEDERAALERGLRVKMFRVAAVILGGFLAGVAGAYISMRFHYGRWYSGLIAGRGWIAIGVVILGYWHPLGVLGASYFVGLLFAVKPLVSMAGIPAEVADAAPYLAVLVALIVATLIYRRLGVTPPSSVWRVLEF